MNSLFLFLIMFIIIVSVIFIVSRVLGSKIWTVKRNKIIIISYISIGVLSMIILHFTTSAEPQRIQKAEFRSILQEQDEFWEMINSNKVELNEDYIVKEWSYELPTNQLTIKPIYTDIYGVSVIVEKREDPDSNEIYAKTYITPHILDGFDLTGHVSTDRFEFVESDLIIKQISEQQFDYYKISPNLKILEQFRNLDLEDDDIYNHATGSTILFLNVPEHVKIIDESGYILFQG